MSKPTTIRKRDKKGLTDKELIEKYEAGAQPVEKMIETLLSKPNPNAPAKVAKRP